MLNDLSGLDIIYRPRKNPGVYKDIRDDPIYGWGISLTADEDIRLGELEYVGRSTVNRWKKALEEKEKNEIQMEAEDVTKIVNAMNLVDLTEEQIMKLTSEDIAVFNVIIDDIIEKNNEPQLHQVFDVVKTELKNIQTVFEKNQSEIEYYDNKLSDDDDTIIYQERLKELQLENERLIRKEDELYTKYKKIYDAYEKAATSFLESANKRLGKKNQIKYLVLNNNTGDYYVLSTLDKLLKLIFGKYHEKTESVLKKLSSKEYVEFHEFIFNGTGEILPNFLIKKFVESSKNKLYSLI